MASLRSVQLLFFVAVLVHGVHGANLFYGVNKVAAGFKLTAVNTGATVIVKTLNTSLLSATSLKFLNQSVSNSNPTLVFGLAGAANSNFLVRAAFLGLPPANSNFTPAGRFYNLSRGIDTVPATELNTGRGFSFSFRSQLYMSDPVFDAAFQAFQLTKLFSDGAVLSGTTFNGGIIMTGLNATNVFFKLPAKAGPSCTPIVPPPCAFNTRPTYTRDANLCFKFDKCVPIVACPFALIKCPDQYKLVSWPAGASGCPTVACDPFFIEGDLFV